MLQSLASLIETRLNTQPPSIRIDSAMWLERWQASRVTLAIHIMRYHPQDMLHSLDVITLPHHRMITTL